MSDCCPTCKRPLDLSVACTSCGRLFTVTLDEQRWFAGRGLANPKRCTRCRHERRRQNENDDSRKENEREHERG